MPRKNEATLKERYSLWFEYFKRSEGYKRIFKQFPNREQFEAEKSKINSKCAPYFVKVNEPAVKMKRVDPFSPKGFTVITKPAMKVVASASYFKVIDELYLTFKTFQFFAYAIYNSYDYWWEKHFPEGEKIVEEITEEWYHGESLKYLPDVVISIPNLGNIERLVKEFRKLIAIGKRELKNPKSERFKLLLRSKREERRRRQIEGWLYPSASFRYDEVKEYLESYDKIIFYRKRGMTLKNIFCKKNPKLAIYLDLYNEPRREKKTINQIIREETEKEKIGETKEDRLAKQAESSYRLFKLHWRKADKIIRNAAMGIFPGPY